MKIYVNHEKFKSLKDLFLWFFQPAENQHCTLLTGKVTYLDEECTEVQCTAEKYRSMDDLYDLAKTYFPKTNIKTVFSCLLTLNPKGSFYGTKMDTLPNMGNCATMGRIRFLYYNSPLSYTNSVKREKLTSLWSWKELFDMVGIKNNEDLKKYVNKKIP